MTTWKENLDAKVLVLQHAAQKRIDAATTAYQKHGQMYQLEFEVKDALRAFTISRARLISKSVVDALSEEQTAELFALVLNTKLIDEDGAELSGQQLFNRALHDWLIAKYTTSKA